MLRIFDHAAQAVARLIAQYRGKPRMEGLAAEVGTRAQTLEDVAWDLLERRLNIDKAFGAQLDGIGKIVAQPRNGLDDAGYRPYLKARTRTLLSSGTIPDLVAIFLLLVQGSSRTIKLTEYFPASVVVRLHTTSSASDAAQLGPILQGAKAAGVRAILEYQNDDDANTFCFANGPGLGFGAGKFAGAK